ncbi:MAG: DUF1549 and DUF1553 domain-containing protein [Pirellulales bacterium]
MPARLRQTAWIAIACWLIVVASAGADEADAVPAQYVPTDNGITPDDLWALAPIERPALPEVKRADWPSGAIDRFVLAGIEAEGMEPAPRLSRRKLVRRLYFDLWGLPPTPDDVRAALADDSPDAYERLVDRLLASPHYGERWARYWLDLVRFAESNGYERDALKPGAWQYRDWVIQAFNDDKPYDRFVLEQLAGDELPDATDETRVATGFLRVGTFDDEPNDPAKYKYEQLDDLVHATSTAMLGMTLKCARCHDHKFDPIPQRDYYAVLNFFVGGRAADGPLLAYTDVPDPPPVHLLKSGEANQPGEVVPPGFLSMLPVLARPLDPPPAGAQTSTRRTQLARWITDRRNPLTARVMVNRLWQHHFGEGLVRTPDNFGMMSESPTHPELLDWLAAEFMDGGWRIKRIHRLILLSSTYRMDSNHPREAEYAKRDFNNQRLWRANRRRLDAEALRDAILAASGELNLKAGGPSFYPPASKEALEGLSKKDAAWGTSPPDEQRRRSIYMMTRRSLLLPLMTTFDFADTTQPCSQRNISTVAPQALALLNNHFVHGQSTALAERVAREAGSQAADRIERAWWLALGRAPTLAEREAALAHLEVQRERFAAANNASAATPDPQHLALASLCHVLLNTNEFIYVD